MPTNTNDCPRLREGMGASPNGDAFVLYDRNRIAGVPIAISRAEVEAVQLFNGLRKIRDVPLAVRQQTGITIAIDEVVSLVDRLDAGLFLDNDTFQNYLNGPVRQPSCIGCYPPEPSEIHAQMQSLFTADGGPGLPLTIALKGRLRAVLVPHMDYARGNVTYGYGFKELAERTDAKLFFVIATSHYSSERFTLTRMNFQTPLGIVETDQTSIDRIVANYGEGLFADPYAHLPEHSIELEVLVLQHIFPDRKLRIVPLLVGSFQDCIDVQTSLGEAADIARMIAALRVAEAEAGEPVCYIISGDLAHIGPKFRDPSPVSEPQLSQSHLQDMAILKHLETADTEGYFEEIAVEGDARRICGLPPTYLALAAAQPKRGRVLHYQQYVEANGYESVSFAAVAFED